MEMTFSAWAPPAVPTVPSVKYAWSDMRESRIPSRDGAAELGRCLWLSEPSPSPAPLLRLLPARDGAAEPGRFLRGTAVPSLLPRRMLRLWLLLLLASDGAAELGLAPLSPPLLCGRRRCRAALRFLAAAEIDSARLRSDARDLSEPIERAERSEGRKDAA